MKRLTQAYFDIETSFGLFYSFAHNIYEAQLAREHTPIKLLMVSFKEPGKRPKNISRIDFDSYLGFVAAVRAEMIKYDILMAHNGKKFDLRMCNTFFAEVGLEKIDKFPKNLIDTKNEAKREWALPSYSLKFLLRHFGIGTKLDPGGEERWFRCMEFNADGSPTYPQDWKEMAKYCNGDVVGGEALFEFMDAGGWIRWPNIIDSYTPGMACPRCHTGKWHDRGEKPYTEGRRKMYACSNCNKQLPGEIVEAWTTVRSDNSPGTLKTEKYKSPYPSKEVVRQK